MQVLLHKNQHILL